MPESDPILALGTGSPRRLTRFGVAGGLLSAVAALVYWTARSPDERASSSTQGPAQEPSLTVVVQSSGQPVPEATVVLVGEHCQQRLQTDTSGSARVQCPAGDLTVTLDVRGYAREQRAIAIEEDGTREVIDLRPAARLSGMVMDDEERPLAAVTVVARLLGAASGGRVPDPWTAWTDEDGRFTFETLPAPGPVALEVRSGPEHEPVSLSEVRLPNELLLVKLRRTGSIDGTVKGVDNRPVAQAVITLAGSGVWPARVAHSDELGAYEFPALPEGVYEIRAEDGTRVSAPLEGIALRASMHRQLDLLIELGATLRGSVRDAAQGQPLLGAELDVVEESLSGTPKRTRSDGYGNFSVQGLRAVPHRVTVRSSGYVPEQRWVTPGPTSQFQLLRAAAISGKIEDASGRPVPNAVLEINGKSVTGGAVHMLGPVQEAPALTPVQRPLFAGDNLGVTTGSVPRIPLMPLGGGGNAPSADFGFQSDEDGRFHIEGLPPGQLTISAYKPGFGSGKSALLRVRGGDTLNDVLVELPRGFGLRGRVLDSEGQPAPHVRVDLSSEGDAARSTATDEAGRFAFDAVRGSSTIWARPFGQPVVKVVGSAPELAQTEIVLSLVHATDKLSGRVLGPHNVPLEGVSVRASVLRGQGFAPSVLTEADGSFEFSALPPPPYTLDFEHPDYVAVHGLPVNVSPAPLTVHMEAGTQLAGSVRDALTRGAVVGAEINVRAEGGVRVARTGHDGRFELQHLPYGAYELGVRAERYMPELRRDRLESAPGVGLPLEISLMPAASVSGEVVDALGRTVWNAQVAAGNPPNWEAATRTDHAGRFQLRELAPGEHVLSARHGEISALAATSARAVAGDDTPGAVIRLPRAIDEDEIAANNAGGSWISFSVRGSAIVIERIAASSAAAKAGLQSGDVLLSINGEPVRSAAQARGMLAPVPGRAVGVNLTVRRDQRIQQLHYVR